MYITQVRDFAFNGKYYVATVRIGKLDTDVKHKPIRGESRSDIVKAMIEQAKETILINAVK